MIIADNKQVHLACGVTDMRKSIDGLVGLITYSFKLDPYQEALFVFCNRNHNILKIVEWDSDGFWVHVKKLEKTHFRWPSVGDEPTMVLTIDELNNLLCGTKVELKLKRVNVFAR